MRTRKLIVAAMAVLLGLSCAVLIAQERGVNIADTVAESYVSSSQVLITRPGGTEGLTEVRLLQTDLHDAVSAIDKLEDLGGWAEYDMVTYDPQSCGKDSSGECSNAVDAACEALGSETSTMEFAVNSKCTGTCANGSSVVVTCVKGR